MYRPFPKKGIEENEEKTIAIIIVAPVRVIGTRRVICGGGRNNVRVPSRENCRSVYCRVVPPRAHVLSTGFIARTNAVRARLAALN